MGFVATIKRTALAAGSQDEKRPNSALTGVKELVGKHIAKEHVFSQVLVRTVVIPGDVEADKVIYAIVVSLETNRPEGALPHCLMHVLYELPNCWQRGKT
jgi:hypothetical protein